MSTPFQAIPLSRHVSETGVLTAVQFDEDVPFQPKRLFFINNVPTGVVRGKHAHRKCIQYLICTIGTCEVLIDTVTSKTLVKLSSTSDGLLIPPRTWLEISNFSPETVLLVLASDNYDLNDYIFDIKDL